MAWSSRLDGFDPDVAATLRRATPAIQQRVAEFAAEWAVAQTGLADPALVAGSVEVVAALVAELEDRYSAVSEAREAGRASTEDMVAAFGRARAASAIEFGAAGNRPSALRSVGRGRGLDRTAGRGAARLASGGPAEPGPAADWRGT